MLLLDDALAGGGRLVLCTGEAGIGKTRLAEEAAASAAVRGVPVAWARVADRDSLPPYGLWRLVLDEPAVQGVADDPSGVGLWSRVFSDAERPALADGADSATARRFAMFAEVRRRLAQAARLSGLLLVLDDLQWADEASAVLLADVVRQLRGTPILVLATYRESAASGDTNAGLLPRLSADADTERVDLRGLPAGAVGICCSPPGCRLRQRRPVRCTPKRGATRSWSASWPACSPSSSTPGRCRCRDGWRRRRPPARAAVGSRPGAGADSRRGRQQLLGLAYCPGSWTYLCWPCSARWTSAGPPGSWWPGTVP